MKLIAFMRTTLVALSAAALLSISGLATAADDKPSATITISETQVGFLLTGDWGHGTLTFRGQNHMFHMSGAKIGGIGFKTETVSGSVYNLHNIDDFYGTYFKAEAGFTVIKGMGGSWIKNGNGVSLHVSSDSQGVALSMGVEGLKISK